LNENENIIDGFDINQLNILNELQLKPKEPEANLENDQIKSQYVPPLPQNNIQLKILKDEINENDVTKNTAIADFDNVSVNLGIGDWGLGIGPNPQSPIPNPQSPIPKIIG
jgi:hypothetical protein